MQPKLLESVTNGKSSQYRQDVQRGADVCVVHLVRKKNGVETFRRFLESYLKHPAGIEHQLLIVYKGFKSHLDTIQYAHFLKGIPHSSVLVSDLGFDLRAYFAAVEKVHCGHLCFINSFSVLQDSEWLLKLHRSMTRAGVGLVGATASCGTIRPSRQSNNKNLPAWKKLLRPLMWKLKRICLGLYFDSFPNCHVRTNGFMISRDTMLKIRHGSLLTKLQTYRLESGRDSITKQVERMGLTALIVGKNGEAYEKQEWHLSRTFWADAQENLLISDNQTRRYEAEDLDGQLRMERLAWGDRKHRHAAARL